MVYSKCAVYNIMVVIKKEFQPNLWMEFNKCLNNKGFIKTLLNMLWHNKFNKEDDLLEKFNDIEYINSILSYN